MGETMVMIFWREVKGRVDASLEVSGMTRRKGEPIGGARSTQQCGGARDEKVAWQAVSESWRSLPFCIGRSKASSAERGCRMRIEAPPGNINGQPRADRT